MLKSLALCALLVAVAAPAVAQTAPGMGAMQYYVGTWSCVAGPVGKAPAKATATYTLDAGLMRSWVYVPAQATMKTAYAFSTVGSYDRKTRRYIQTSNDNTSAWTVSAAKPWMGNTERWTDQASSDGKLGRTETIRTKNSFSFAGYPTVTATKPVFKGSCKRS